VVLKVPTVKPAIDWHYKEISAEQPERKMMAMGAVGVRFGDLLEGSMVRQRERGKGGEGGVRAEAHVPSEWTETLAYMPPVVIHRPTMVSK
jgi:hypothetical protein